MNLGRFDNFGTDLSFADLSFVDPVLRVLHERYEHPASLAKREHLVELGWFACFETLVIESSAAAMKLARLENFASLAMTVSSTECLVPRGVHAFRVVLHYRAGVSFQILCVSWCVY